MEVTNQTVCGKSYGKKPSLFSLPNKKISPQFSQKKKRDQHLFKSLHNSFSTYPVVPGMWKLIDDNLNTNKTQQIRRYDIKAGSNTSYNEGNNYSAECGQNAGFCSSEPSGFLKNLKCEVRTNLMTAYFNKNKGLFLWLSYTTSPPEGQCLSWVTVFCSLRDGGKQARGIN